jgi:hypothetical protein
MRTKIAFIGAMTQTAIGTALIILGANQPDLYYSFFVGIVVNTSGIPIWMYFSFNSKDETQGADKQ